MSAFYRREIESEGCGGRCGLAAVMAPGSTVHAHNPMKDKEGGRREKNFQEVLTSGSTGLLSNVDVNRIAHVESNTQSWPALSKSILPPPKTRHHSTTSHPVQAASKTVYMDCKENKAERGGSLTSRISSLSPGTKRKMLGYAADGSIPPLPPRQKRVKKVSKHASADAKYCTKYKQTAEPSGLLGDLKPGIMRQHTRTRTHIHALLGAVVGDLLQKDTSILPAAEKFCSEIQASDIYLAEWEALPAGHIALRNSSREISQHLTRTAIQEAFSNRGDFGYSLVENQSELTDAPNGPFDVGMRTCQGVIGTHERTFGFLPFQRNGQHACNRNAPILPADSRVHTCAGDLKDPTNHDQQPKSPVNMKHEHDPNLSSGGENCLGALFECKQEDPEEDICRHPLDIFALGGNVGFLRHEEAASLQQQESTFMVSVADTAANVATCWLELLSQDVKGRLAALQRSKRRVSSVIVSGELDLDAPLLPSSSIGVTSEADGQPIVDSWRKVFESMDRALTLEGQKLESWLQQIHVMQAECERDLTSSVNLRPTSCSEPIPERSQEIQHEAASLPAASMASTAHFVSQIGEYTKELII